MEAIGIGDLHYDGHLKKYVQNANHVITDQLTRIIDYAESRGISNIFLYGDVCHNPVMSYEAHLLLMGVFISYPDMQFYIILGNHDMNGTDYRLGHSLSIIQKSNLPNVHIYEKPKTVTIDGTRVHFMPYPSTDFNAKALNVAHTYVRGVKVANGKRSIDTNVTANAISVIGHVHDAQVVKTGRGVHHYSGTIYQTRMGESFERYFHHIVYNNPKDYQIDLVPFTPNYYLHTLIVNHKDDLINEQGGDHNLYRLVIKDGVDISPSDWAHLNVVSNNTFKSKDELQAMMHHEQETGVEFQIHIPDFLQAYMEGQGMSSTDINDLLAARLECIGEAT